MLVFPAQPDLDFLIGQTARGQGIGPRISEDQE
jgi:hypothetical protein